MTLHNDFLGNQEYTEVVEQSHLKLYMCVHVSTSIKPANVRAIYWNNLKDILDFLKQIIMSCGVYAV